MEKISSNPGKVHFEVLVYLLKYIRNKNILGLIYCVKIEDATISDFLRHYIIKIYNQFVVFSDSIC